MRKLILNVAMAIISSLIFTSAMAQTEDAKWNVGIHGGLNSYNGDLGSGFFNTDQAFYGFGGVSVARYLSPHFDVVAQGTFGEVGHVEDANSFRTRMNTATVNLRYSFFNYGEKLVRPYLFAGVGYMGFTDLQIDESDRVDEWALPDFGGGLSFRINDSWNFLIQETFLYSTSDEVDGEVKDINDLFLQHTVGFTYNFGKAKDDDMDGVPNSKDDCPQVKGLESLNGCPDTDKDGIADNKDKCPTVAGLEAFMGCPDTDKDGIMDSEDKCPTVAGLKEFMGCTDSDGDGIADNEDKCPDVKGVAENNGCPADSDGDGIADNVDKCPNVKGVAANNGCPADRDGDGVADADDKCPDVKGKSEYAGCPLSDEETKIIKDASANVFFETGSAVIKKSSYADLDKLVTILKKHPEVKARVEGHTDNTGNAAKNLSLSQARAKSVADYLISHGEPADHISSEGYGITRPVATNDTREGRAKNRRVEIVVSSYEEK